MVSRHLSICGQVSVLVTILLVVVVKIVKIRYITGQVCKSNILKVYTFICCYMFLFSYATYRSEHKNKCKVIREKSKSLIVAFRHVAATNRN